MTTTRLLTRSATTLLALLLGAATLLLTGGPAIAADCADDPVTAVRGAEPLCDTPNGRTFTLTVDQAEPGQTISFSGTGFVRDAGGGQTLTLKFNDIDIIGSRLVANDDGTIEGEVTLPSAEVFRAYQEQYGAERWWVRALVGSGRADGADDAPSASLHDEFAIPAGALDGSGGDDSGDDGDDGSTEDGAGGTDDTTPGSTSGTLPETGIGDHRGGLFGGALVVAAAAALLGERRWRRRRA